MRAVGPPVANPLLEELNGKIRAGWAANRRLEISKFKFEFPRARTYEMIGLVLGCIEAKCCK